MKSEVIKYRVDFRIMNTNWSGSVIYYEEFEVRASEGAFTLLDGEFGDNRPKISHVTAIGYCDEDDEDYQEWLRLADTDLSGFMNCYVTWDEDEEDDDDE